jgi:tRNA-dihydrouridine synthase B
MVTPLTIGALTLPFPVVLAPMAGYTDAAMRSICAGYGAGMTATEVVNADGLVHGSKLTWQLLESDPADRPIAAHLYGSDPVILAEAAGRIDLLRRFDVIDINCGCPVRKIVAKDAGVALMKHPERIAAIVSAVRRAVSVPVTVKTRIGLADDCVNVAEVAAAAEAGGAAAIAVHGRLASNHHRGPADWDAIARVKAECGIPVIGNGGINIAADVPRMLAATGVDGVMIGRAAVGAPWIFQDARLLLAGETPPAHSAAELRAAVSEQLRRLVGLKVKEQALRRRSSVSPDTAAALHFRAHLVQYLRGMRNWVDIRRGLNAMTSSADILRAVDTVLARQELR